MYGASRIKVALVVDWIWGNQMEEVEGYCLSGYNKNLLLVSSLKFINEESFF